MSPRVKRPSAPMVISVAALVVALSGTSYAAAKIDTDNPDRSSVAPSANE
ncbi:hypothetical protein [Nocardioides sp.]|nr:hypothetical protein [Nocardioides sp.]